MKKKKLQVFVSSTYTDLIAERQAAVEAILNAGHIPAGMELFSAGDETQLNVIKNWIDESDVYMLILGGRYGSLEPNSQISYTQIEYEYAIEKGKPYFAVVITEKALDEKVKNEGKEVLEQDEPKKLKEFRAKVLSKIVREWDDKKDIKLSIHETLNDFEKREEIKGWVRAENTNMAEVAEELARLAKENDELRRKVIGSTIMIDGLPIEVVIENMKKFKCDKSSINEINFHLLNQDKWESKIDKGLNDYKTDCFNLLQFYHLFNDNFSSVRGSGNIITKLMNMGLIYSAGLDFRQTKESMKLIIYLENNQHLLYE